MSKEVPKLTLESFQDELSSKEILNEKSKSVDESGIKKSVFDESTLTAEEKKL